MNAAAAAAAAAGGAANDTAKDDDEATAERALFMRVRRALRANAALYDTILSYTPVSLTELDHYLQESGVAVSRVQLTKFVAKENITFH